MADSKTSTSRFLSYVLRHRPDAIGLELDAEGWANIGELIVKADVPLTRELLLEIVRTNDKKRFAISNDGRSIRASQGHSVEVDLGLEPRQPPDVLFHGTAIRFLDSIKAKGLLPKNRQYVHLSSDRETAVKVGQRHGKPIVLRIKALEVCGQGGQFFLSQNGVWLTEKVSPRYIQFE